MFRDEIKNYTAEELELIIETQQDLYTDEEMSALRDLLNEKMEEEISKKNKFIKDHLPIVIKCPKCDGPNSFSNDTCKFCGAKLDKEKYYKTASIEYENKELISDDYDFDDTDSQDSKENRFLFQYVISFIIPIVGFIMGAIMMAGENEARVSKGKVCIILGIISVILYLIIVSLVV